MPGSNPNVRRARPGNPLETYAMGDGLVYRKHYGMVRRAREDTRSEIHMPIHTDEVTEHETTFKKNPSMRRIQGRSQSDPTPEVN